ncbi:MAG: outer membrane lipoprotein-sorting protein [Myxococcota bacterium]|nr:outer membrane lipoprotein-sorting protein [Myxococcota bacterium]
MITLLALSLSALAQQSAAEIIEQAKQTQKVDNSIQQIRMVLVSKSGAERVRELEMRIRRDDEVLSSYTRFSHPSDVSGTQLIVVDNPDALDEQLLYLPALKRVQRIAGRARTGSFMGSDFAYEDLEISGADEAVHALVSEDAQAWVIDTTPSADSSYSRIRTTVSKADYLPRTVAYFDKKGEALKVLTVEETAMDGETVIPVRSVMRNLQKGTTTRMEILEHQLNVSPEQIPDETFTASFMERNG